MVIRDGRRIPIFILQIDGHQRFSKLSVELVVFPGRSAVDVFTSRPYSCLDEEGEVLWSDVMMQSSWRQWTYYCIYWQPEILRYPDV